MNGGNSRDKQYLFRESFRMVSGILPYDSKHHTV